MALLDAHVARQAQLRPDAEAATDGSARLTWRALDERADRLAARLQAAGVGPGGTVLLMARRSVGTLAALVGILRSGAAYVPLEARTPPARRRLLAESCRPAAALCDPERVAELAEDEVLCGLGSAVLAEDVPGPDEPAPARVLPEPSPDALACVLYTSGSTGQPKGVMLSHRSVDAYAAWAEAKIGIGPSDRILCTAPFYFDMSLFDLFCGLRAGAALCIAPERVLLFPKLLLDFAEREGATVWKGVSSLLAYLCRTGALAPGRLPAMRAVLFGGEELPSRYLRAWMGALPGREFWNFFGPTEATGASLCYRVPRAPERDDERIPIGLPREITPLYLLGSDGAPVGPGETGEIALGGVCISAGYLGDPERTARSFVADPWRPGERMYRTGDLARRLPDGNLAFVGRKDDQVKVMGYRIELGDVEAALTAIAGVAEAAVLVAPSGAGGIEELVAYAVLTGERSAAEILAELKGRLPFYMLPRQVLPIARLPRGERGKIDRRALEAHHCAPQAQR